MNAISRWTMALALIAWSGCALAQTYTITELPTLGGSNGTYAFGVNNSGQVTGYFYLTGGPARAFLYSNGVIQNLGTLGGTNSSYGMGINDFDQVTGYSYTTGNSAQHAFLYSDRVGGKPSISNPSPHAPPRMRLQARQRGP
jgi:probable HAF family extracellular repeat protein